MSWELLRSRPHCRDDGRQFFRGDRASQQLGERIRSLLFRCRGLALGHLTNDVSKVVGAFDWSEVVLNQEPADVLLLLQHDGAIDEVRLFPERWDTELRNHPTEIRPRLRGIEMSEKPTLPPANSLPSVPLRLPKSHPTPQPKSSFLWYRPWIAERLTRVS